MLELPHPVKNALDRLHAAGFEAYIVGGCVRDALMGRTPGDYDLCTSALPRQTEAVFAGERVIETGLQHGTVTVLLDGMPLEITTFRVDGTYSDARRPDSVTFTPSLEEDLARRDFTVNAMAWSPETGLRDPFGGRADLAAGVIRCVGEPERRFTEDALRILRALRFAATLEFSVDPDTAAALRSLAPRLSAVSAERVYSELCKLICGSSAERVILEYPDVLGAVLPELLPMIGFDQHNEHHCFDVLTHCARAMACIPPEPVLRWAALLHDAGKPACFTIDENGVGHFYGHAAKSAALADRILERLRADNETRRRVTELVRLHDRQIEETESAVRRALSQMGEATFFDLLTLKRADNLAQAPDYHAARQAYYDRIEALAREILARRDCLTLRDLAVKGEDLLALGIPKGPAVGKTLHALLTAVLDGKAPNEKEALIQLVNNNL